MDRLKENQLTQRATRRPCEFNYTNADIHHQNVQPAEGYQFEYPVNWTGDPSTNKVIGLRRISYRPSSVNLAFEFKIDYDQTAETESGRYKKIPIIACYTSDNTFEECIIDIQDKVNKKLKADNLDSDIALTCIYNKDTGKLTMLFESPDTSGMYDFNLVFDFGGDGAYSSIKDFDNPTKSYYKREFLKLFNQEITKESVYNLYNSSFSTLDFSNVWNRDTFYCHASFSDSPRKIIGINKDFWMTPSVFYEYSDNSNDFNIYFTTDTVNRILPRNGVLLIQISYIFNYQTSYLSY